eukprot:1152453-Pelagomonas_calceolata.AAC.2
MQSRAQVALTFGLGSTPRFVVCGARRTHSCIASGLVKSGRLCVHNWAFECCVHAHAYSMHHAAKLPAVRHAWVNAQRFGNHLQEVACI